MTVWKEAEEVEDESSFMDANNAYVVDNKGTLLAGFLVSEA